MKSFTRVFVFALSLAAFPVSYSYADERAASADVLSLEQALDLVNALGTADSAVGGEVPNPEHSIYDMYARQLSFREKSKTFRQSIDVRRASFEEPRTGIIHQAKDIQSKIFEAENAASKSSQDVSKKDAMKMEKEAMAMDKETMEKEMMFSEEDDGMIEIPHGQNEKAAMMESEADDAMLKEQEIPEDSSLDDEGMDEDVTKRKVITSEDAPDFDPSDL